MELNNKEGVKEIGFALYLKKLMLPVIVELAFILSYIIWPEKVLYFDLIYCIIIIVYFRKLFSFSK